MQFISEEGECASVERQIISHWTAASISPHRYTKVRFLLLQIIPHTSTSRCWLFEALFFCSTTKRCSASFQLDESRATLHTQHFLISKHASDDDDDDDNDSSCLFCSHHPSRSPLPLSLSATTIVAKKFARHFSKPMRLKCGFSKECHSRKEAVASTALCPDSDWILTN